MPRSKQEKVVQAYADHLNFIFNKTVSRSRLAVIPHPDGRRNHFVITRLKHKEAIPLELNNASARLFFQQSVKVVNSHCEVLNYSYRYQTNDERQSWLIRWEYVRNLGVSHHPHAHVHVNAKSIKGRAPKEFDRLHMPAGRVPIELIMWHLISDWNVTPLRNKWESILEESIKGFYKRRRSH